MEGIGAPAAVPFGARADPIDTDGQDRDRGVHPVAEHQLERRADLPEPTGPIRLDLSIFDSLGPSDDLREPLPLQSGGDDVHGITTLTPSL